MENLAPLRNHVSATQFHIAIIQCTCGRNVGKATMNSIQKYSGGSNCFSFCVNPSVVIMKFR